MRSYPDPAYRRDRACAGVDQDVFFPAPSGQQSRRIAPARALCAACPVLAECAGWAEPLARAGALTGCVVAGVYLPSHHNTARRLRDAAADELVVIAATGRLDVEGAA
ncbi:WhiB family transcriptional regulator [Nocardia farcinica]|uniref:WhiB family transcriptional regulator n=1 Tax=Nocardia farcinica TaxID=37329 RepID=UPI00189476B7|nr:WhiB family transcriptional regulator [Nocardia farcinica]MBF6522835.1 WhiB family transcriptional regulator [Nocardia farcinica]